MLEGLEAADALAFQAQMQMALHEQAVFELLHLQIMLQRLGDLNDLIARVDLQFGRGQFALQPHIVRFQMAHIYNQRHNNSQSKPAFGLTCRPGPPARAPAQTR